MADIDPDLRALQEVRDFSERAWRACESIHNYTQEQIDRVCAAMAAAGAAAAGELAKLAVEETGIGRVHHKILKNLFGSEATWDSIEHERTVGIVARDDARGVIEVATPVGVVAGIVPTTNPTSTALFKALIAVKGKNAIVISPHPRAKRCIGRTVDVLRAAIGRAGGPPDLVLSLSNPTIESTAALMRHPRVSVILATGGTGLVQAAYSSGKPAYGVGPGNVPVYVDRSADVQAAARAIVESQNFDNGTLCCSEQALVLDRPIADAVLAEMQACGAHLCSEDEARKLAAACAVRGHMNPDVVGKDPHWIAAKAGFQVPRETTLLLAHQGGVGREWPLSIEILAPVLSVHLVDGWREGCRVSMDTLRSEGLGHTCGVWALDERVVEAWSLEKPAGRILVNCPTTQGAIGYATNLVPSVSLGCGPQAGNITSDNISARHLINVKRIARARSDWQQRRVADHARAARLGGEEAPRGSLLPGDPGLRGAGRDPARGAFASVPPGSGLAPEGERITSNWRGNPALELRATPPGSPPGISARISAGFSAGSSAGSPAGSSSGGAPAAAPSAVPANALRPLGSLARSAPAASRVEPTRESGSPSRESAAPRKAPSFSLAARAVSPVRSATVLGAAQAPRAAASASVASSLSESEVRAILSHAGQGCPLGPCQGCPHHNVSTGACEA